MSRSRYRRLLVIGVLMVSATAGLARWTRAQDDGKRKEFMRLKLETAKTLIEGLALENFDLLEKNARALKKLSMGAEWEVSTIPQLEYVGFTSDFQRAADELRDKAKAKNLDGSVLAYQQLTASCVKCHQSMRKRIP